MDIVLTQTDYTEAEALEKLSLLGDPVAVIRDYLKIQNPVPAPRTPHQIVYAEIGKFMEDKYRTVGR